MHPLEIHLHEIRNHKIEQILAAKNEYSSTALKKAKIIFTIPYTWSGDSGFSFRRLKSFVIEDISKYEVMTRMLVFKNGFATGPNFRLTNSPYPISYKMLDVSTLSQILEVITGEI